jgi:hypothetical protein
MTAQDNPLDAVAALMRERQKYEGWMEALEQRRGAAPEHVYERVHRDYEGRLREVMRQLAEHSPALEEQAGRLEGRLAELAEEERTRRDERAERELRSLVGEVEAGRWEAYSRESDTELARVAGEQEQLRGELGQVRELIAAATTPPRALTPISTPAADPEPVPAPAPAEEAAATAAADEASPFEIRRGEDAMEELMPSAGGGSGGDEEPPLREPASAAPEGEGATAHEASPAGGFDELEFLKSVADDPRGAPRPKRSGLGPSNPPGSRGEPPFAANVTGNRPIVLRNEGGQPAKSLKCTECGSMNYPTEWYCERCGAELAAL